jgi:hypothetical protein
MKTIFAFLGAIIFGFILSGCSQEPEFERLEGSSYYTKKVSTQIFEALENDDKEALISLFSNNARDQIIDLDTQVNELFDFFKGKEITRDPNPKATYSEGSIHYGEVTMTIEAMYVFQLGSKSYFLQFRYYISNIKSEKNLHGVSIILITGKTGFALSSKTPGIYMDVDG